MSAQPRVVSVNVGTPTTTLWRGREVTSAIWKSPVEGRVPVAGVNLSGDNQADRTVHGGPDKAIYSYSVSDYAWWQDNLGRPLEPGTFGENLTIADMDVSAAVIGELWQVGSSTLRVTQPRLPCYKLGMRMDDHLFTRRFAAVDRPGAYLTIVRGGQIGAGDPIGVLERPDHGVTVTTVYRAYLRDHSLAEQILDVPGLPAEWQNWAERATALSG